jgi:hypothetical protein
MFDAGEVAENLRGNTSADDARRCKEARFQGSDCFEDTTFDKI